MAHDAQLRVKKLSDVAVLPVRGSPGAAGYDLARYARGVAIEFGATDDDSSSSR